MEFLERVQKALEILFGPIREGVGLGAEKLGEASARAGGAERHGIGIAEDASLYIRGLRNQMIRNVLLPIPILIIGLLTGSSWIILIVVAYWVYKTAQMFLIGSPAGILAAGAFNKDRNVRAAVLGYAKVAQTVMIGEIIFGLYLMIFASGIKANLGLLPIAIAAVLVLLLAPGGLKAIGGLTLAILTLLFLFSTDFSKVAVVSNATEAREANLAQKEAQQTAQARARAEAAIIAQREIDLFRSPWILFATDTGSETPIWLSPPTKGQMTYTYSFDRNGATHVVEGSCKETIADRFECSWKQQTSRNQSSSGKLTLIKESEGLFSGFETYVGSSATTGVTPVYVAHSQDELATVK